MKVGILGSSDVAKSLARGFLKEGHQVMLGSREPAKLAAWVNENGKNASSGTFIDTAKFGELVVLAVQGTKSVEAIQMAQPDNFKGKVVIDTTNPLDMSGGLPNWSARLGTSSGELNQKALPGAFVVKAFNTVGNAHFHKPQFAGGPPDMFLCGDDAKAKEQVSRICKDFGWNPIDVGGIETFALPRSHRHGLDHHRHYRRPLESGIQAFEKVSSAPPPQMKPYIICHMVSSVDGKIDGFALSSVMSAAEYEATGAKLKGDAWICGRTTMQQHFAEKKPFAATSQKPAGPRPVFVARKRARHTWCPRVGTSRLQNAQTSSIPSVRYSSRKHIHSVVGIMR